jgi:hypothetical protein
VLQTGGWEKTTEFCASYTEHRFQAVIQWMPKTRNEVKIFKTDGEIQKSR